MLIAQKAMKSNLLTVQDSHGSKQLSQSHRGKLVQLHRTKEGYATSFDGTKIWYHSVGKGVPIICCNGLGCSTFYFSYIEAYFKKSFQVVTFDYRGHGRSGPPQLKTNFTISSLVKDLKSVLDALKIKQAIFVGHSMGTQIVYEFYKSYPRRCAALIPCFGTFGKPMDTFFDSPLSKYVFEGIYIFNHLFPKLSKTMGLLMARSPFSFQVGGWLKIIKPYMVDKKIVDQYMDHFTKVDPVFLSKLLRDWQQYNSEENLKNIRIPTLIFGADEDKFTPLWVAKKMHHLIPQSELLIVKKGSHVAIVEQPELINLRMEKFLKERVITKTNRLKLSLA